MSNTITTTTVDAPASTSPAPVVESNVEQKLNMVGANSVPNIPTETVAPVAEEQKTEQIQEDPKFAARFAALSRKEKELINREKAFKENQVKLAAYEKALQSAKQNPLEYLQAAGLTLEQALEQIISKDEPITEATRLKQIEQKVHDYEEAIKKQREDQIEYEKSTQLNQIKQSINQFVNENAETYELIKEYNAIDDVWSVIERTFIESKGKTHLTIEQASKAVEDQLFEEANKEAERIARLKKLQKNQQVSSAIDSIEVSKLDKVSKTAPTLTNQSVSAPTELKKFKTREESLADAAKLLKWK